MHRHYRPINRRGRTRNDGNRAENGTLKGPERMISNKSSPVPFLYTGPVIGYGTDAGKRKINQDALLVLTAESGYFPEASVVFAAVCDGMGGHAKGEEASRTAVLMMERWFRCIFPDLLSPPDQAEKKAAASLKKLFEDIHRELQTAGKDSPGGAGTTACALLLFGQIWLAAHTGDSRIYAFSETPALLTRDHSWVMAEYEAGRLPKEEMKADPRRNVLLKCLGLGDSPEPDLRTGTRRKGAAYLLCSDGFWREGGDEIVGNACCDGRCVTKEEVDRLIRQGFAANAAAGETDNMTAVLIRDCFSEK